MIAFRDLSVRYPHRESAALDGVSLVAERGRITAVVGPNGSGKSTLVRALVGRIPLLAGDITLDGHSIRGSAAVRREQ